MLRIDQKRLTAGALVASIVLVAWAAAHATWTLLEPADVIPHEDVTPTQVQRPVQEPGRALSDAHLLGEPERKRVTREVPVTRLDLELLGVYNTKAGDGFAVIREGKSDQKLFRRGAVVAGGARLSEVHANRVVLEVGGRIESLYLDKDRQRRLLAGTASGISGDAPLSTRLGALRKRAMADPASLGRMIEASPVRSGGRMEGYRIHQRVPNPLFSEVGLEDGDVLLELNDILLDEPQKGFKALQELASARQITARVMRAGRTITIRQRLE